MSRAQKEREMTSLNGWHPGRVNANGYTNEEHEDTPSYSNQDGVIRRERK